MEDNRMPMETAKLLKELAQNPMTEENKSPLSRSERDKLIDSLCKEQCAEREVKGDNSFEVRITTTGQAALARYMFKHENADDLIEILNGFKGYDNQKYFVDAVKRMALQTHEELDKMGKKGRR